MSKREKVLVALSGGVDSAVAAALLVEQGHEVHAAYMKNWINEVNVLGHCPWEEDVRDATAVAETLDIPFEIVNLMDAYKSRIVEYLLKGYQDGVTPNPDAMCNREIKFGVFLEHALAHGFESVATGHYARRRANDDGTADILEGLDPNKDQTYFLALMRQEQAFRARFPVGHLLKPEVRDTARRFGLPVAEKKDSQGICFIGEVKMSDFLRAFVRDKPGAIVTPDGKKVGMHKGLHLYTLGQGKGLGLASNTYREKYVVVEKRVATNELVVAFDRPESPGLWTSRSEVVSITWVNRPLTGPADILARPRYRAPSAALRFEPVDATRAHLTWREPQRAIAPGQICAFYDGDVLLGGGVFSASR